MDSRLDDQDVAFDAQSFARTVERVQAYVRDQPGAWDELSGAAHQDPEGTTRGLLELGTVLLELTAGAFSLSPEEVLEKVSRSVTAPADAGACGTPRH